MNSPLIQKTNKLIKVVLFGPESTGKTTLSRQLAAHFNTAWTPEYLRQFAQQKWDKHQQVCEVKDVLSIATGQMQLENKMAESCTNLLICDTDLLETKIYAEYYFTDFHLNELDHAIKHNHYDLYLLTYIDTPWQADDLRDRPEQRQEMFDLFERALIKHNKPYQLLKGDETTRLAKAIDYIEQLFK